MLIGDHAVHLAAVHVVDHQIDGRVLHVWQLPPAGAVELTADTGPSPEEIARSSGWAQLRAANRRLQVPLAAIRSARTRVDVMPDPEDEAGDETGGHPIVEAVVTSVVEALLAPRR